MAAGHALQQVLEVCEGLDVVELCGGDEGADRRPAGGAAVGSGEQVVLATERNGGMARSTVLVSNSMRPSSRKQPGLLQRISA